MRKDIGEIEVERAKYIPIPTKGAKRKEKKR
jgi:hypothetical protein